MKNADNRVKASFSGIVCFYKSFRIINQSPIWVREWQLAISFQRLARQRYVLERLNLLLTITPSYIA